MTTNTAIFAGFGLALGAVAVGVWGAKGTRGLNGASGRRGLRGPHEVRELQLGRLLRHEASELGIEALRAVKERLDPAGICNPGVLLGRY